MIQLKFILEFEYVEILDSFDESDSSYTTRKNKDITIRQLLTHTSGIIMTLLTVIQLLKLFITRKSKTLWITEYYVSGSDVTMGSQ